MKSKQQVVNAMMHLDIPQLYDDVDTPSEILVKPKVPKKRVLARKRVSIKAKPRKKPSGKRWVLNKEVEAKAPTAVIRPVSQKRKSIFSHKKTRLRPVFRNRKNEAVENEAVENEAVEIAVIANPVIAKTIEKKLVETVKKNKRLVVPKQVAAKRIETQKALPPARLWFFLVDGERRLPMALASYASQALLRLEGVVSGDEQGQIELCSIPVV